MLFDFLVKRRAAHEIITQALLDCTTSGDLAYIDGLCDMAYELGAISLNDRANYTTQAIKKKEAAQKAKREKEIALAAERKAKAAEEKKRIAEKKKEG